MSRRFPPSIKDIAKAFDNVPGNKWLGKENVRNYKPQEGDFSGRPPSGYICNRCGKAGHHLQACPTNLDPAFDRPPDSTYQCAVCHVWGEHFKSVCPRNTDPHCITQKRKALSRGQWQEAKDGKFVRNPGFTRNRPPLFIPIMARGGVKLAVLTIMTRQIHCLLHSFRCSAIVTKGHNTHRGSHLLHPQR